LIIEEYQINISGEREIPSLILKIKDLMHLHARESSLTGLSSITTATLELTRNIIAYAGRGKVFIRIKSHNQRKLLEVEALDQGPGIENIALALQDHYSSGKTLGLGLPGARRLMDSFEIESSIGHGTQVIIQKWI